MKKIGIRILGCMALLSMVGCGRIEGASVQDLSNTKDEVKEITVIRLRPEKDGSEWGKTKSKVHSAVEEVAKDLVELYATRQRIEGYQFGPDTVWQQEFEEMFPYEETTDQLNAIEDTKHDMESRRVMDRLICGDVGYGKTEIAIRAAFKAVQEGKN